MGDRGEVSVEPEGDGALVVGVSGDWKLEADLPSAVAGSVTGTARS
jgi:hypothetical protein